MQLLAPAVEPVPPDGAVDRFAVFSVEFAAETAEVVIRGAHVLQFEDLPATVRNAVEAR